MKMNYVVNIGNSGWYGYFLDDGNNSKELFYMDNDLQRCEKFVYEHHQELVKDLDDESDDQIFCELIRNGTYLFNVSIDEYKMRLKRTRETYNAAQEKGIEFCDSFYPIFPLDETLYKYSEMLDDMEKVIKDELEIEAQKEKLSILELWEKQRDFHQQRMQRK